jgi:hypothetical protein
MLRRLIGAAAMVAVAAAPTFAQSADDIIAKSFAAMGGVDKLKAVSSVRMTGKLLVGPGMEAPIVIETKRPRFMRVDISIQGMTMVQAFDGTTGWLLNPMSGRSTAEALPGDMTKMVEEQADMDGALMDYKAKGHTAELVGRETAGGTECFKIKLTENDGDITWYYFDTVTFLGVKQNATRVMRGAEVETETMIGGWKDVGGVMYPHSIDAGQKGSRQRQLVTIEKIEVNVPIDDERFRMPK